jgi:hypothetical protein
VARVHPHRTTGHAAEDVAPADDDGDLDAHVDDLGHLLDHPHDGGAVDAERVIAHQRLTRQLQQDSLVGRLGIGHGRGSLEKRVECTGLAWLLGARIRRIRICILLRRGNLRRHFGGKVAGPSFRCPRPPRRA